MGKLLAAGGVILLVLAALLLYEMKGTTTVDAAPTKHAASDRPADTIAPTAMPAAPPVAVAPVDPSAPRKIRTDSDAFVFEFDDVQPKRLMKQAAKCYTAGNRVADSNAKMKLTFKDHIVNGEVTITDVKMVESTLNNKALEQCMIEKVSAYHWHSEILPDWVQDDMLLVRPEGGMRKFLPESMNYEGSGPEFPGGSAKEPVRAARPGEEP